MCCVRWPEPRDVPPRPRRRAWLVLLVPALGASLSPLAAAQVQRCVGADGQVVFTDRSCESVGAEDWRQPAPVDAGAGTGVGAGTGATRMLACPRTARDLAATLSAAIQATDLDRASALYDWVGVPKAQQPGVLARLDALVRRPLAGLEPIFAEAAAPTSANDGIPDAPANAASIRPHVTDAPARPALRQVTTAVGTVTWAPAAPTAPAASTAVTPSSPAAAAVVATPATPVATIPHAPPAPRVVGIRVLQSAPDGIRTVTTPLSLVRRWGCWWIRF